LALKEIKYNHYTYPISYEIVNPKGEIELIILHGWGSDKELMKQAFLANNPFKTIYIDLPGFGRSTPFPKALTSFDYADIIGTFLKSIKARREIILGHSFGGKIATLLEPKLLVLLSSAGILEKKPLSVQTKIALFKLLKPFFGKRLYNLFVSKDAKGVSPQLYETFKNVVNEDFEKIFKEYNKRSLIFWGKEDKATSLESGRKIASLIKDSKFIELEGDHYFFLDKGKFIIEKIREEYEKL